MNWDVLEGYVTTLFEMINFGDINCWEAIAKYKAFSKDIRKTYEIKLLDKGEQNGFREENNLSESK